jgi:hypothetical protein
MADQWRYRGRTIGAEDITFIRELIAQHPRLSRRKLSVKVCEAWQWRQANGALRDMVCRGLLLMLHRAGAIELPKVRQVSTNPLARREPPPAMLVDQTPITDPFQQIMPIAIEQVRRTADEPLFNSLIEHHHYLGYEQPVGEHLKYLAWAQPLQRRRPVAGDPGARRPIACLAWSSAPRHLGSRDRYIGWNA